MADNTLVPWRQGAHYGIHVYADDVPVATFHNSLDAATAVKDHNGWLKLRNTLAEVVTGDWSGRAEDMKSEDVQARYDPKDDPNGAAARSWLSDKERDHGPE